jgi:hypothetical protein
MAQIINIRDAQTVRERMMIAWNTVNEALKSGPVVIEIRRFYKSREQERHYHALIGEIAKQVTFDGGKRYSVDVWKARLVEQFAREKELMGEPLRHPGETVVSLDGQRIITVRPSTKQFLVREAADFIEYLHATGIDMNVRFTNRAQAIYAEYKEAA